MRNPGVLCKQAITLDHVSGGRLEMAIGAGGYEEEQRMLGIVVEALAAMGVTDFKFAFTTRTGSIQVADRAACRSFPEFAQSHSGSVAPKL